MTWLSQLLSVAAKPFQWWVVVAPWEQALRIRLGKTAALLGPGCHFRIPFFDRVYRQSLRLRCRRASPSISRSWTPRRCMLWGLSAVRARVLGFAYVRTYRLLTHDYRSLSGLDTDHWDGKPTG